MVSKENLRQGDFVWHTLKHNWAKVHKVLDTLVEIFIGGKVELVTFNHINIIYNQLDVGDCVIYNGKQYKVSTLTAPYFVGGSQVVGLFNPECGERIFTEYEKVEKIYNIRVNKELEDYCDSIYAAAPVSEERPMDKQVGGNHYKQFAIQPLEFAHKNNLSFCQGNVIKYICRYPYKNGVEDLKKARDYIDKLIAFEESENAQ